MRIHCCLSQISETVLILSHFNICTPQGCVPCWHGSETEISHFLTLIPNPPNWCTAPMLCMSLCHYSASIFCLVFPCALFLWLLWSFPSCRKRAGVDDGQDFSQQGYFLEFTTSSDLDLPSGSHRLSLWHGIKRMWKMELRLQLAAFFTPTDFVIFRQGHVAKHNFQQLNEG